MLNGKPTRKDREPKVLCPIAVLFALPSSFGFEVATVATNSLLVATLLIHKHLILLDF